MNKISVSESRLISLVRIFLVASVISAHVVRDIPQGGATARFILHELHLFGCVGVIGFFLIAGFLHTQEMSIAFLKRKAKAIVLPWLFCSFCSYLISAALNRSFSLFAFFKWFLGVGTWYYYLTIYVILIVLFSLIKRDVFLYFAIVLNVLSLAICTYDKNCLDFLFCTPFLNVFNWIGFFALGLLARKYDWHKRVLSKNRNAWLAFGVMIFFSVILYGMKRTDYFSLVALGYEICAFIVMLYGCSYLVKHDFLKSFEKIERYTFPIYLLHMQIVQPICNRMPNQLLFEFLKPIVGLVVMVVLFSIVDRVIAHLPRLSFVNTLLGIRPVRTTNTNL